MVKNQKGKKQEENQKRKKQEDVEDNSLYLT